jgi:hypothetical protein
MNGVQGVEGEDCLHGEAGGIGQASAKRSSILGGMLYRLYVFVKVDLLSCK